MKRLSLLFILTYLLVRASLSNAQEVKPHYQPYGGMGLFVSDLNVKSIVSDQGKFGSYYHETRSFGENKPKTGFSLCLGLQRVGKSRLRFSPEIQFYTSAHRISWATDSRSGSQISDDTASFTIHQTLLRLPLQTGFCLNEKTGLEIRGGICIDLPLLQKVNGFYETDDGTVVSTSDTTAFVQWTHTKLYDNDIDKKYYGQLSFSWLAGLKAPVYKKLLLYLQISGSLENYSLGKYTRQLGFSLTACFKFGKK